MDLELHLFSHLQKTRILTTIQLKIITNNSRRKKGETVCPNLQNKFAAGNMLCVLCLFNYWHVIASWVGQSCLVLVPEETGTLLD